MLTIMSIPDEEPLLTTSPLIRGLLKMADYIAEHGGIGLTASGAFNRKFVHWAGWRPGTWCSLTVAIVPAARRQQRRSSRDDGGGH
jgi:hypothetical protein